MAFNPFHTFRKNQKVIFAVLTIICMFVFILQFGSGDIFSKFGIGRGQGRGDKVVTLYGRDVTSADIEHTRQARQIANEFVLEALGAATKTASKEVEDYKPEKADGTDKLATIRDSWRARESRPQFIQFEVQQRFITPDQAQQEIQRFIEESPPLIQQDYDALNHEEKALAASDEGDKAKADEQKKLIANLRLLLKTQFYSMTRAKSPFYFGGGVKPEDLLDFDIWKHQADKLGIVLTKADARRALAHEAGDHDLPSDPGASWAADPAFKDFFDRNKQTQEDRDLVPAVVDEFRVLMAKDLLAGRTTGTPALDDGNRIPPDPVTPYDFWKFYSDNRTTLKVAFLPIPVESFVSKVDAKPTTQDLRDLFEEHKSQEPAPNLAEPGFKEPRRMKVEYVTIKADTPYYKARTQATVLDPAAFYVTAGLGEHLAGAGVVPTAALYAYLNNDPLQSDYDFDYEKDNKFALTSAAGLLGLGGDPTASFGAHAVAVYAAQDQEQKSRLRLISAVAIALDGAAGRASFPGLLLPTTTLSTTLPHDVALRQLAEKRQKDAATRVIEEDVTAFAKELDKIKAKPDEAQALIQKAVKERGWEYQDKAGLDDRYSVDADENLKPMKEALLPLLRDPRNPQRELSYSDFLYKLMKPGVYELHGPIPAGTDKKIAFWRSEDKHAQELTFDQARPRVEKAWTFQQARILALQAANLIDNGVRAEAPVEAVRSLKDAGKFLKDSKVEGAKLGADFELGDIARLLRGPLTSAGVSQFQPYTIPAGLIPYAPPDLLDRLMTLDKPGKTLLFKDLPATHYYVAVLDERDDVRFDDAKKDKKFLDAYEEAGPQIGRFQDEQLWSRYFLPEHRAKYHEALMRQLRVDAAGASQVDDKGKLILSGKTGQPQQQQQETPSAPIDTGGGDFGM